MTRSEDSRLAEAAGPLRRLHEAKVLAELAAADLLAPGSDRVAWRGAPLADIAVVKGAAGVAEAAGGAAFSGADGEAAAVALEKLGHRNAQVFYTLSRPEPGTPARERLARLRMQIEAVDAELVLAVDPQAAEDVWSAFGVAFGDYGEVLRTAGRRLVALEGLEASLGHAQLKKRVWKQFQAAGPLPSAF